MKSKNDLKQLISSLTSTEKAYFRKFAARHYKESSIFLKLFNEIESNHNNAGHTEKDIKERFKNEKFIKQLPVTKNYLYKNILRSLNLYHAEDNIDIKISQLINNAILLNKKELFAQSLKIISKAKELAERFDKPAKLLDAVHVERQALRINSSLNEVSVELMRNYDEEELLLERLKNIYEYRRLYDRMVITATAKGFSAGTERFKTFEKILGSKYLKDFNNAKFFQSKAIFLLMHCFINNLCRNYTEAYEYGTRGLELINSAPGSKNIVVYEYLLLLQELMTASYSLGKRDESERFYDHLLSEQKELMKYSPQKVKDFMMIRTLTGKLNINSSLGKERDNLEIVRELGKITASITGPAYRDEIIVTDFLSAAVYFSLSMYTDSLHHINRIFNSNAFILREDIQVSCRIMNLIVHYELGNMGSIEYYIRSTYRYLKKLKKLNTFEQLLFDFLKETQSANSDKEISELFLETRKKLKIAGKEEPGMLQVIDLDAWLESKLLKKPYLYIINKRANIH